MTYSVTMRDGKVQIVEDKRRDIENDSWGLEEITEMLKAKAKSRQNAGHDRRKRVRTTPALRCAELMPAAPEV